MENDDVMPNDGYFVPREPKDQQIGRKKERAQTLEALPVLQDLVTRMIARINFYGSVDSIPTEVKLDAQKFLLMHNSNEMTRNNLRSELEWMQALLEEHAPRK